MQCIKQQWKQSDRYGIRRGKLIYVSVVSVLLSLIYQLNRSSQEMKDPEVPADVNQSDLSDRLPKFPSNLNLPKWSLTASSEISL